MTFDWIEWSGGQCPVPATTMVRVQIRAISHDFAAKREPTMARGWRWDHRGSFGDIIAYQVVA